MAYFVEYQRALRALRVAGIILGVLFLLAVIGRLSSHSHGTDIWLSNAESSPTAHVTHQTLPDGSVRTIVDDPVRRVHLVAVKTGRHIHVDNAEPADANSSAENDDNIMGSGVTIHETHKGGVSHTTIDADGLPAVPVGLLFATSIIMGFIVASLLGGVLAKENDGHLELAWTKPVTRERYAIASFAVDLLTIVCSQLMWVAVCLIGALLFFVPTVRLESYGGVYIALSLLGPLAWYAALTGWSASLKRGPGIVIGLGWLFATLVPALSDLTSRSAAPVVSAIHAVLLALTYLDPLAYISLHVSSAAQNVAQAQIGALHLTLVTACWGLAALTIFYLAVAVAQWRRVEA